MLRLLIRKISNFNRVDSQRTTAESAAALSHHTEKGGASMTDLEDYQDYIQRFHNTFLFYAIKEQGAFFCVCYSAERHFKGIRYKTLAASFSSTESPVNQGFFCPYCVTRARRFLMRSAACLRVIRFRQSGQYLTLLKVDAKEAPHSVSGP